MNAFSTRILPATLLATLLATAAYAAPRSGPDPQARADKLASVPGLTQAQRDDILRIENEGREAQRALMEKTRSERQTLRDETISKLRVALGDKAYADYMTWRVEQRGEHRRDGRGHDRKGQGPRSGTDGKMPAPAGE